MTVLEFIELYLKDDEFTDIEFYYYYAEDRPVMDFEYSFFDDNLHPSDFIAHCKDYSVFDGMLLTDLDSIWITHKHCCGFTRARIIMEYTYV